MAPTLCQTCQTSRAQILRPKTQDKLCGPCFLSAFESEIHTTITTNNLFQPGETVAIGASGGKDSTVLASVLKTLNERHNYGLQLVLLSIDEGITGYRDDSLATVRRNAVTYDLPLRILPYKTLYGWSMDEVVAQIGKKGNCTYCGVFRRQALDRGAAALGIKHVVTGHNADDLAETVLMNLLRGDLARLARSTGIVTQSSGSAVKRSKPLKYAFEKEIVMYARYKNLEYFSTECIYSPEAFRGSARALVKDLERVKPRSILDLVQSGEDMAKMVPKELLGGGEKDGKDGVVVDDGEEEGGCGSSADRDSGGEMASMEHMLKAQAEGLDVSEREMEITMDSITAVSGQRHDRHLILSNDEKATTNGYSDHKSNGDVQAEANGSIAKKQGASRKVPPRKMGNCERCGYISSQKVCKACMLLEGLNKNRPKSNVAVEEDSTADDHATRRNGVADSNFRSPGINGDAVQLSKQIDSLTVGDTNG